MGSGTLAKEHLGISTLQRGVQRVLRTVAAVAAVVVMFSQPQFPFAEPLLRSKASRNTLQVLSRLVSFFFPPNTFLRRAQQGLKI